MKPRVRIRQERPQHTNAPFRHRMWELFVFNPGIGKYEYYGFTLALSDAIRIAHHIYERPAFPQLVFVREATA